MHYNSFSFTSRNIYSLCFDFCFAYYPQQRVHVSNLGYRDSLENLATYFGRYGTVLRIKMVKHSLSKHYVNKGPNKGYAFITFSTVEAATEAIEAGI